MKTSTTTTAPTSPTDENGTTTTTTTATTTTDDETIPEEKKIGTSSVAAAAATPIEDSVDGMTTTNKSNGDRPLEIGDECDVYYYPQNNAHVDVVSSTTTNQQQIQQQNQQHHRVRVVIVERRWIHWRRQRRWKAKAFKMNVDEASGCSGPDDDQDDNNDNANDDNGDNNMDKNNGKVPSEPELDTLQPHEVEYYVHPKGYDRRLDKWLKLDQFILESLRRVNDPQQPQQHGQQQQLSSSSSHSQTHEITAAAGGSSNHNNKSRNGKTMRRNSSTASDERNNKTNNKRSRRNSSSSSINESGGVDNNHNSAGEAPSSSTTTTATTTILTGGNWHGASGDPSLEELERENHEKTKVKNIERIFMGGYEVECWYYSPFPDEFNPCKTLYFCEYCLKYCRQAKTFRQHRSQCIWKRPPGKEIYREVGLSVFEIDGQDQPLYCQNLCLLSKLFLDHKTLYYDVNPFYFYIVCKVDEERQLHHIVGYFSKEKASHDGYNLACILTLPQYQKEGYGKFIISLSYELTKREGKTGSPEKPLSDLGKVSYRSYWKYVLLHLLAKHDPTEEISVGSISEKTGMKMEDIISTLQQLGMLKCWKGQHVLYFDAAKVEEFIKTAKTPRLCNAACLKWDPPNSKESAS